MTSIEERMRIKEMLDRDQAEIDRLYRESEGMTCPPCIGNCNQGRDCPSKGEFSGAGRDEPLSDIERLILRICYLMTIIAVLGLWMLYGDVDSLREMLGQLD